MSGEYAVSDVTKWGYFYRIPENKPGELKDKQLKYAEVEGRAVFEGDIVLGTVDRIAAAEAEGNIQEGVVIVGEQYRWENGVIPYTIHSSLPNQQRVTDAIAHWEANTPLRFPLRSTETAYVRFIPSDGCWSYVGRQGTRQDIGLAGGCLLGSTIHEIGHAVGLWHEQSREDRDSFVTVNFQNILPSKEHNFNQHIADGDDVGPYDYDSIMHYGRTAFTKNGLDTITPPAGVTIGQRNGLSAGDIQAVIYMYGEFVLYIGNKRTKELHKPGCRWVDRMAVWNKKFFTTQEEAITSGYNGCWYCNRHFDTG